MRARFPVWFDTKSITMGKFKISEINVINHNYVKLNIIHDYQVIFVELVKVDKYNYSIKLNHIDYEEYYDIVENNIDMNRIRFIINNI